MLNKIKILTIILIILFISTSYTVTATKEKKSINETVLQVGVFGASLLGLRQTGFIINNNGDEPINDIQYSFSVKSISNNNINFSYSGNLDPLKVNSVYLNTFRNQDSSFGLVIISISVTSSNAGEATETTYGFQIGHIIISKTYLLAWF